jgi:hypothetical protein
MSLLTFDDARPWAKSIRQKVADRSMPPWFADPAHGKFANDTSLTDAQIATIVDWAERGAPRGDPADVPEAPAFDDIGWKIGEPDLVFAPERSYRVSEELEDRYVNLTIPNPLTEDKWIGAIELKPGARQVVHHILVYIDGPGASGGERGERGARGAGRRGARGGGRQFGVGDLFAKYAPGNNPDIFPAGYGKKLPAGSRIRFQMHYHKTPGPGTATDDLSQMAVKFADGPIEHPVTSAWILHPTFNIPAGASDYSVESRFTFKDDGHIYSLLPHMHYRGKNFTYVAEYPDGRAETLLHVPRYDFNWQISYHFAEPKAMPEGTVVRAIARWDNSEANPVNPDPTANVRWGEASTDEMMIGFMDYTYVTKKGEQETVGLPAGLQALVELGQRRGEGRGEGRGGAGLRDLIRGGLRPTPTPPPNR